MNVTAEEMNKRRTKAEEIGTLLEAIPADRELTEAVLLIGRSLDRLAVAVEGLAPQAGAPDIIADLAEYKNYDWDQIGAEVKASDKFGPTRVSYRGKVYTRRAPVNKFGPALWFSRCSGKNGDGENKYERLIMFKDLDEIDPDPLSNKLVAIIKKKIAEREDAPIEKKGFKHNAGYSEYFTKAKNAGINAGEARALAEIAGINFQDSYKNTDYGKALKVLDYAIKVKEATPGFDMDVMDVLVDRLIGEIAEYQGDVEKALTNLLQSL